MINKEKITTLYTLYGFECDLAAEECLVFISKSGYFQNVEIVITNESISLGEKYKQEYEKMGYSVRLRTFNSENEIHSALFRGFFNIKLSNQKLMQEYDSFCSQQSVKLAGRPYVYISGEYTEGPMIYTNVIERIRQLFEYDQKQLIILEASAGYGKTCTSFEVIKTLIDSFPDKIPLMAELSKNRKANIFRYVLLDEINRKFPGLSLELVTSEIHRGQIILIIDGFDELLSKSYLTLHEKAQDTSRDTQTMLDTIAQLFPKESKTKILLTTRKSSIFVGEDFDSWVTEHLPEDCNVTRLQLSAPSLRDWIGTEKTELLKSFNISLHGILNPVLLTLLRSEPIESFAKKYTSNDKIIDDYLRLLLQREQTRQSLTLTPDEQLETMSNLAYEMVVCDISSEDIDFIKMILAEIIDDSCDRYLGRYDLFPEASENKPTKNELVDKLSHHALLDRVSVQSNQIGFLNEFIYGLMIANSVLYGKKDVNRVAGKYLDLAVTSYSSYSYEKRAKLYVAIKPALIKETAQRRLRASMSLLDAIDERYIDQAFDSVYFTGPLAINEPGVFTNCYFSDCSFRHCVINTDAFISCQFINCFFHKNEINHGETLNCDLVFYSCVGHETFESVAHRKPIIIDATVDYEQKVLEQFWRPGFESFAPRRIYNTLLRGVAPSEKVAMAEAIKSLVRKGLLIEHPRYMAMNLSKLSEIKDRLHR